MKPRRSGMDSVRRLYLYAMTAIALGFVAIGAGNLLQIVVSSVFEAVSDRAWSPVDPDWERQQLSLAIPFIVIALPVWFLHWRTIERGLRGDDAAMERDSAERGLFLFAVLSLGLYVLAITSITILDSGLRDIFGIPMDRFRREDFTFSLALAVVIGVIWIFHLLILRRDAVAGPMVERGPLLPQAFLHVASGAGLLLGMFGVARVLDVLYTATIGDAPAGRWWQADLATAIAMLGTGLVAWAITTFVTERLLAGTSWWGRTEPEARLRHTVWGIFLVVAAFFVILGLTQAIEAMIEAGGDAGDVIKPLGFTIPFLAGWAYYRWRMLGESPERAGPMEPVTRHRLHDYGLALLGLGWAAGGLVLLITRGIGRLAAGTVGRDELAWPIAMLVAGGSVWAWQWWTIRGRLARDPEQEQASAIRRGFLLAVLGASIVALLVGLTTTIYQVLQRVLEVSRTGSLASDIDWPVALAVTGLVAGAAHGRLLLRDLAVRPLTTPDVLPERLDLVLTGPPDVDLRALLETLRDGLPDGYHLDVARPETRSHPHPDTPESQGADLARPTAVPQR